MTNPGRDATIKGKNDIKPASYGRYNSTDQDLKYLHDQGEFFSLGRSKWEYIWCRNISRVAWPTTVEDKGSGGIGGSCLQCCDVTSSFFQK